MRKLGIAIVVLLVSGVALAKGTRVRGHTRKDGSYVAPHHRSSPNGKKSDNWGTKGNSNPYTGKEGSK